MFPKLVAGGGGGGGRTARVSVSPQSDCRGRTSCYGDDVNPQQPRGVTWQDVKWTLHVLLLIGALTKAFKTNDGLRLVFAAYGLYGSWVHMPPDVRRAITT